MGNNLVSHPRLRNVDCSPIGTHMIILDGHLGRIVPEMATPGKTDVHILRVTKAVEFPHGWGEHSTPIRVIEVDKIEVRRSLVGMLNPTEAPLSIYREEPIRLLLVSA